MVTSSSMKGGDWEKRQQLCGRHSGQEAKPFFATKPSLFSPSPFSFLYLCSSLRSSSSFKEMRGNPSAEFTAASQALSGLLFSSKLLSMFLSGKISGVTILSSSGSEQAGDN